MKVKIFTFLCLIGLVFMVGCDMKNEVKIENNNVVVCLNGNATTGYLWSFENNNPSVLVCVNEEYVPFESGNMVGTGGIYNAVFAPQNDGTATITFKYQREWEENPIETKIVVVEVQNGICKIK